jgi:hypothetical protein
MASFVPKKRVCSLFFFSYKFAGVAPELDGKLKATLGRLAPHPRAPLDPAEPRLPFHDLVTHMCDFSSSCHFFGAFENLVVSSHFLLVLSPPSPPVSMRLTRFRCQVRCLPRSFKDRRVFHCASLSRNARYTGAKGDSGHRLRQYPLRRARLTFVSRLKSSEEPRLLVVRAVSDIAWCPCAIFVSLDFVRALQHCARLVARENKLYLIEITRKDKL